MCCVGILKVNQISPKFLLRVSNSYLDLDGLKVKPALQNELLTFNPQRKMHQLIRDEVFKPWTESHDMMVEC